MMEKHKKMKNIIIYFIIENKLSMDRVSRSIRSGGMMDEGSMMSSMDRGRVNRSRVVRSRGRGIRSGVMRGGMGMFGVFDGVVFADLSFVFDISVVLLVFIDVIVNDLGTAIGQLHSVLSCKIIHHH